ncbi:MAG: hypothetical protein NZ805_05725 [Armatimonadetes bacterium]|nr:hypothetical protein [Armatimonadota bacterium]MDW8029848.1 hypothetical protein [Armatimonadota bacterium]
MLKRTMILLGLTTIVSALLLIAGCGGSNSNPIGNDDGTSRLFGRSNGSVTLISQSSPAVVEVYDPDGLWTISVQACPDSLGFRLFLVAGRDFPNGATSVRINLPKFSEAMYHTVALVNRKWGQGTWKINPDGGIVRLR